MQISARRAVPCPASASSISLSSCSQLVMSWSCVSGVMRHPLSAELGFGGDAVLLFAVTSNRPGRPAGLDAVRRRVPAVAGVSGSSSAVLLLRYDRDLERGAPLPRFVYP